MPLNAFIMSSTAGPSSTMNNAGRMQQHQREDRFDGNLHRLFLGSLTPFETQFDGLGSQHVRDCDAVFVGLDHRSEKTSQFGGGRRSGQREIGFFAGLTHLHVPQGADQFLEHGTGLGARPLDRRRPVGRDLPGAFRDARLQGPVQGQVHRGMRCARHAGDFRSWRW